MLEHEYKYTITKESLDAIAEELKKQENIVSIKRGVQINYYYDTQDFVFQSEGTTIRIRQKESGMQLQVKKKNYYGLHKNLETVSEIIAIPSTMTIDNKIVEHKGHLVTDRTRYIFADGVKVYLDINFYCGIVDYEMEIELPTDREDIENIINPVWRLQPAQNGKATRFYIKSNNKGEHSGV